MKNKEKTVSAENRIRLRRRILLCIGLPLWVLAGFILAAILVSVIDEIFKATGLLAEGAVNGSLRNAVITALAYTLTLVIVTAVPFKLQKISTTKEELGLTRLPSWLDMVLAPTSFVAYLLLAGILISVVDGLFPSFDAEQAQEVGFDNLSRYYEYILAFITLVIIAPVAEEVLMRGYLYGKLRKVTSAAGALIITSLLFSLMHFQWNVALSVLPLGILLAVLRETTGSIWAGILLHMIKNGFAFYFLFINPTFLNTIGG